MATLHPLRGDPLLSKTFPVAPKDSLVPADDGYDYQELGPLPAYESTKERAKANISRHRSKYPIRPSTSLETPQILGAPDTRIVARERRQWRAKIPYDLDSPDLAKRESRFQSSTSVDANAKPRYIKNSTCTHLLLDYMTAQARDLRTLILQRINPEAGISVESSDIIGFHAEIPGMQIDHFETFTHKSLAKTSAGNPTLICRLLKRVKEQAEEAFVNGSYLKPMALRYDFFDSRTGAEKCSTFICFPFFQVGKTIQKRQKRQKGRVVHDPATHPTRSLLQLSYRMNSTIERDKAQSIGLLSGQMLKWFIQAPPQDTAHLPMKAHEYSVFVPQMWAVISDNSLVITTESTSETALRGPSIHYQDEKKHQRTSILRSIRIFYAYRGSTEKIVFPIDRCRTWFGLLSVHQHLLNNLDTGVKAFETRLFKFHVDDQVIEASTWASIQEAVKGETLDIWLKKEVPKIHVENTRQQESRSQPIFSSSNQDHEYAPLDEAPVVLPFLTWPVVDNDDREVKNYSSDERTSRFLYAIYRGLSAKCVTSGTEQRSSTTRSGVHAEIIIEGKSNKDVVDLIIKSTIKPNTVDSAAQRKIIYQARILLDKFFIQHDKSTNKLPPIELFWGALYEIFEGYDLPQYRAGSSQLGWLAEKLSRINALAEKLHMGVYYRHAVASDSGSNTKHDAVGTYIVLLDSIVDALKAVFHMLIEVVRVHRFGLTAIARRNEPQTLEETRKEFANQACRLLVLAGDQLIVEANRVSPDGQLDSMASPEVILVTLMERLIRGVFGDGTVDVIGIYGAVMEHLTFQVRDRPSFRWLQALHELDEELDIMRGVLLQQQSVLTTFCSCLDPSSFAKPTVIRKMSFVFSRNQIERVQLSVRDQLLYCAELKGRCNTLTGQNVQLVQTMHGTSLRMGVGHLFDQAIHGTSKAISRHLPSRRTPANLQSTRNDSSIEMTSYEDDAPDPIRTPSAHPQSMTDQQQGESVTVMNEQLGPRLRRRATFGIPKTTRSEQFFDAYFQKDHVQDERDFLVVTLDLLWQHFPERNDLEGKICNPDDPGDGIIYDKLQVQEAEYILDALYRSWSAAQVRRVLPCAAPPLPRFAKICLILNGMHKQKLLVEFLNSGLTDEDLPLSKTVLLSHLKDEHQSFAGSFLTEQYRAVSRSWEEGDHLVVEYEEPLPLIMSTMYDGGSFGMVSRVQDAFTKKIYARKQQIVSPESSMTLAALNHLREEAVRLKSVKHKHIVRFVKSYQRGESYGMLLEPAATTDLSRLLRRYAADKFSPIAGDRDSVVLRPALLTAFGCLSQGLAHIHRANIRHKDIKPSNILYVAATGGESAKFLWADFGLAYDFSASSQSRTRNTTVYSRRYAAPELIEDIDLYSPIDRELVHHEDNRINSSLSIGPAGHGRSTDVFSLGCVFLEILARLVRRPLPLDVNPTGSSGETRTFYNSLGELRAWVSEVMKLDGTLTPLFIIARKMIASSPLERPIMDQVVRELAVAGQEFFCEDCGLGSSRQRRTSILRLRRASILNLLLELPTDKPYPPPNRFKASTLETISDTMFQKYPSSSIRGTATFVISWDLQEYLQQELGIDQESPEAITMLCNMLTITGTANEAYATTLKDYMSWRWGDSCIDTPSFFRSLISGQPFPSSIVFDTFEIRYGSNYWTPKDTCIVVKADRSALISLAEQLAWLSAVIRIAKQDEISNSEVSFQVSADKEMTFEIVPSDLQKVEEDSSTCWLPLFKSSIIASGFPIPERAGQKGIELPFSLITDQSGMLYPMTYNGGIYLRGFSSLLYPTARSDDGTSVQWHLIESSSTHEPLAAGTLPEFESTRNHEFPWLRCTEIEKLASAQRTFLGYCRHVTVNLGTPEGTEEAVLRQVAHSKADDESPNPGLQIKTLTAGTPGAGILAFMAGTEIVRQQGLVHAANERIRQRFVGMCEQARDRPVIVYDEARHIGWMVPTLSVILHMAHLWASQKNDLLAPVPHARAQWDAGEAALATIKANVDRELRNELTGEANLCLRSLVEDFMVSLHEKFEMQELAKKAPKPTVRAELPKLYGWDLLDIVKSNLTHRRELGMSEGWMKLSENILVLFCREVGEIIRPAQDATLCNSWNPVPPNHHYLAATVSCLQNLSVARGGDENDVCLKLSNSAYWLSTSESLFDDCETTEIQTSSSAHCTCNKVPQHIIGKHDVSKDATQPPKKGAVLFGTRKLQKRDPPKKIQLDKNEQAVSVVAHVNGDPNGSQGAKPKKRRIRLSWFRRKEEHVIR
ncbi:MAG: hypothetical protein Q9195_002476 [Heterodermia aff. obscurata]